MTNETTASERGAELAAAHGRLASFVREHLRGGCRILSLELADLMRSYVDADRKARQQEALDARRYRYLRGFIDADDAPPFDTPSTPEDLDAKIDAAIAKGERHE